MTMIFRAVALATALTATSYASAATVTASIGGPIDGFAKAITYDDAAARGTAHDRDNPLNALGGVDGKFFEIGLGATIDLTFGQIFTGPGMVVEVTFGNPANYPEKANIYVGNAGNPGSFVEINENPINNALAQGTGGFSFTFAGGPYDTLRIVDASTPMYGASVGGFDIDAIKVSPVPLPAGMLLLGTALAGLGAVRRKKQA